MAALTPYLVDYREEEAQALGFHCWAEDAGHAVEQCQDAYPAAVVVCALPQTACPGPDGSPGFWIIRSAECPDDLWSNEDGWTSGPDFTVFDSSDTGHGLPIGGEWVRLRIAA